MQQFGYTLFFGTQVAAIMLIHYFFGFSFFDAVGDIFIVNALTWLFSLTTWNPITKMHHGAKS